MKYLIAIVLVVAGFCMTLAMGAFIANPAAQAHYPMRFAIAVGGAAGFLYVSLTLVLSALWKMEIKP